MDMTGRALSVLLVTTIFSLSAVAQNINTALPPLPLAEQVINRVQDPYTSSIPNGKPTGATIELSIPDALEMALKYNLGIYFSERTTEQTRAARLKALSDILPNVNGSVSEEAQRLNLKSLGIKQPGFPKSVGPFGLFDLRATGSWNALDLSSIDKVHSATENVKAAQFNYSDARDTVVLAVGAQYLLAIANESRVEAAQAELKTAQALYQLASDQEAAGLAPNIDTLRAKVQLQTQESVLIQAVNDLEKERISLARTIGLPVEQKFRLVNRVPYRPLTEMDVDNAYALALQTRPDYKAALALLKAAQLSKEAAWKEHLPTLDFSGEYGVLGYTPSSLAPNWTAAASLRIPIFEGGRIRADVQQAEAVLKQRQAQVDSLRGTIEQEVQDALLDLKAATQQVEVATTGLDFAQQTVIQSQDRFQAGVTNNVEVIQAQQQLASANDQYIAGLFAHNLAKVLLARSIGNAEQMVKQYLAPGSTTGPDQAAPTDNPPKADIANPNNGTTNPNPSNETQMRLAPTIPQH